VHMQRDERKRSGNDLKHSFGALEDIQARLPEPGEILAVQ